MRPVSLAVILFIAFISFSCAEKEEGDNASVPQHLLGNWQYVQSGRGITIDEDTDLNYTEVNARQLKVQVTDTKVDWLVKNGGENARIRGKISSPSLKPAPAPAPGTKPGYAGIGGIETILANIDIGTTTRVTTDADGNFNSGPIASGNYRITATNITDSSSTTFVTQVSNTDTELGIFNLAEKNTYNFKTELIFDTPYIFADGSTYKGKIRIHNTGASQATGLGYQFDCTAPLIDACSIANITGTLPPGRFVDAAITLKFKPLSRISTRLNVPVTITDVYGRQWRDEGSIEVYQKPVKIALAGSRSTSRGVIITNTGDLITVSLGANGGGTTTLVPHIPGAVFSIALANSDIRREQAYSIAINTESSDWQTLKQFTDTSAFEPDNDISTATVMGFNDVKNAFLHEGDIDFYTLVMPPL